LPGTFCWATKLMTLLGIDVHFVIVAACHC
jgi:hypothetical protein